MIEFNLKLELTTPTLSVFTYQMTYSKESEEAVVILEDVPQGCHEGVENSQRKPTQ